MRILLVAPYYPPQNSPGATRLVNLATEWQRLGADVTVLTRSSVSGVLDSIETPPQVRVLRVDAPPASRIRRQLAARGLGRIAGFLDVPDSLVRWNTPAVSVAVEAHRDEPFEVIWSSSNPLSASLLGLELSQELSIPLVAEFRDSWTQSPFRSWNSRVHFELERRQQDRVMARAAAVVMNTNVARQQLLDDTSTDSDKVHVLTNGFDPADYAYRRAAEPGPDPEGPVTFAHVGNMHSLGFRERGNWRGRLVAAVDRVGRYERSSPDRLCRSPFYLFGGMARLKEHQPELADRMRFHQVGSVGASTAEFQQLVEKFDLGGICEHTERVSRSEALAFERSADVLVLAQLCPGNGAACPAVAAMTYGALASGKPILGLVPRGDMRDLLERSGRAVIAEPDDPNSIADALKNLLSGGPVTGRPVEPLDLGAYTWSAIARDAFGILETVSGGRNA